MSPDSTVKAADTSICPLGPIDPASIPDAEHEKCAFLKNLFYVSARKDLYRAISESYNV